MLLFYLAQRLVAVLAAPVEGAREVVARAERDDADGGARPREVEGVHHGQDPADGPVSAACWKRGRKHQSQYKYNYS